MSSWVKNHADKYDLHLVKMYHATAHSIPVLEEGLLPTSAKRRRSMQSQSGFVCLACTPERAKVFGDMGNGGQSIVYEVLVPVKNLLPDKDQLTNQRSVGCNVGNSIGESLIYGGGARVRGAIEPWAVRAHPLPASKDDLHTHTVPSCELNEKNFPQPEQP